MLRKRASHPLPEGYSSSPDVLSMTDETGVLSGKLLEAAVSLGSWLWYAVPTLPQAPWGPQHSTPRQEHPQARLPLHPVQPHLQAGRAASSRVALRSCDSQSGVFSGQERPFPFTGGHVTFPELKWKSGCALRCMSC